MVDNAKNAFLENQNVAATMLPLFTQWRGLEPKAQSRSWGSMQKSIATLKRLEDGYTYGESEENTGISGADEVRFTQVYVVHAD